MTLLALTSSQPPPPALHLCRNGTEHSGQRCCRTAGGRSLRKCPRAHRGLPAAGTARSPAARGASAGSRSPRRRSQPLPLAAADCGAAAPPHPEARRPPGRAPLRAAPPRGRAGSPHLPMIATRADSMLGGRATTTTTQPGAQPAP